MDKDILYPLRKLHGCMYEAQKRRKTAESLRKRLLKAGKKTAFFVLSPTHGNMGDHAIAEAVSNILCEQGIDYIEITTGQLALLDRFGWLSALDGHLILVNGGGNLGTLWPDVEKRFRRIIQENANASIMCLPNTIYYEDSEYGREELEKSKSIYNAHPRLKLYARERISYDFMKPIYKDVALVPDMVLSLNHCADSERNGCMLCLRSDCEKTLTASMENEIVEQAQALFGERIWRSDMNIGRAVPIENRSAALEEKYAEFLSSELVITDRLHGMIFAAITGTPCVVVDSKSPKLRGCYQWLKELDYIRFAEDVSQIAAEYRKIPETKHIYDNSGLKHHYNELAQDILSQL